MVNSLITGTVVGFVLVVDPKNEKGLLDKVFYEDACAMHKHAEAFAKSERVFYSRNADLKHDPTAMVFLTQFRRDDNGVIEEQTGFDPSGNTQIGDIFLRLACRCGKAEWSQQCPPSGGYICEICCTKSVAT